MSFLPSDYDENSYKNSGQPATKPEISFGVYNRYLLYLRQFIDENYVSGKDLVTKISNITKTIQGSGELDLTYIKRHLFLAWNTECLAYYLDGNLDIDLLRVNNQWKPVQVYYAIYSMSEALIYSLKNAKVGMHFKCLEMLSDYLVQTKIPLLNLAFNGSEGNNVTPGTIRPINFPENTRIPNALEEHVTSIESIACCLRAEHRNRIDDFKPNKKTKSYKYQHNPGNTSVLHFLYKLRIKSNYKDAEIFLSDAPIHVIKGFSENLSRLCLHLLMCMELILMRKIKKKVFLGLVDEFIKINPRARSLIARRKLYNEYVNN